MVPRRSRTKNSKPMATTCKKASQLCKKKHLSIKTRCIDYSLTHYSWQTFHQPSRLCLIKDWVMEDSSRKKTKNFSQNDRSISQDINVRDQAGTRTFFASNSTSSPCFARLVGLIGRFWLH